MSLNVRPSDDYRRHLSGRRNGEPLDMGQRTGRCRFFLLNAVHPRFDGRPAGRLKRLLKSGILKFLSSKCLLMPSVSHCPSDLCQHSVFGRGKSRFSTNCYQDFW